MSEQHEELITIAKELLAQRYAPPVHSVAAALRTKKGEIITGLNIDHFSGFVCAETSALSRAINQMEYDFDSVAAVRMNDKGEIAVVNMCGKCRQIFFDYAPNINVVTIDKSDIAVKSIESILPGAFERQQQKIQGVINTFSRGSA